MPLRVQCPTGCQIHIPDNRAGKMVRCPVCKSVLRIPLVTPSQSSGGHPIDLLAFFVADPATDSVNPANTAADSLPQHPKNVSVDDDFQIENPPPAGKPRLAVPKFSSSAFGRQKSAIGQTETRPTDEVQPLLGKSTSPPNSFSIQNDLLQSNLIADRVQRANADRIILSRFFAFYLCAVAIVNMIPAVYHWHQWAQSATGHQLPRWTYLQIFIAAIHVVYAIYLFQLPDWSALKAVAVVMVVLAALFGLVSTGLAVGGGLGSVARFLNLPFVMVRSACIWCAAMLCLATLTSYLIGREAMNWQRVEQLMRQIESGA